MLDDVRIPAHHWFAHVVASLEAIYLFTCQHKTAHLLACRYFGPGVNLEMEDGSRAVGPETWHNERWKLLHASLPRNGTMGTMIGVMVWSDKAKTATGTQHSFIISLGNLSYVSRLTGPRS